MNEAIKLAIEKGGYKEKALEAIFMETTFDSLNDWYNGNQETYLVLDPLFWQALGKALGWYGNTCSRCRKLCGPNSLDSCNECGASGMYNQTWEHHALHWFELHLNNLITEKFWQDLLNPNRE